MPDLQGPPAPAPLLVAGSLAAVEGVVVAAYGVLLAADIHGDRVAMGVTTSVFFVLLGAVLVLCAWYVGHGRAWARSPVVVTQVLGLGLAWNFLGGSTTWVSVALGLVAAVVLAGLLHPASVEALTDRRE